MSWTQSNEFLHNIMQTNTIANQLLAVAFYLTDRYESGTNLLIYLSVRKRMDLIIQTFPLIMLVVFFVCQHLVAIRRKAGKNTHF